MDIPRIESREGMWVHQDVLDDSTFQSLLRFTDYLIKAPTLNSENRVINYEGEKFKLLGFSGDRSYRKLWSFPNDQQYWHQTPETIMNWVAKEINQLHPAVRLMLKRTRQLAPFNDGRDWVPYRGIFNYLKAGEPLDTHYDGSSGFEYDVTKHTVYSATTYLSIPSEGGEVWDDLGMFLKPKENSMMALAGAIPDGTGKMRHVYHGVLPGSENRLGITVRWLPVEHMLLPGHPDKLLYKIVDFN